MYGILKLITCFCYDNRYSVVAFCTSITITSCRFKKFIIFSSFQANISKMTALHLQLLFYVSFYLTLAILSSEHMLGSSVRQINIKQKKGYISRN